MLTKEDVSNGKVGVGDDVLMIGRFKGHDGKNVNEPSVRFGSISMIPTDPVLQEDGHLQESILIEARSISGYSGSPVFLMKHLAGLALPVFNYDLLGIDWGHIPIREPIFQKGIEKESDYWEAQTNSGIMGVVPAWKLTELLDHPSIVARRNKQEDEKRKEKRCAGVEDSVNPEDQET